MDTLVGKTLSRCRIVEKIGAGGMGEVHRAPGALLGRDVAIKVLPPHLSATRVIRARFEREARTISHLTYPHTCVLHEVGRGGTPTFRSRARGSPMRRIGRAGRGRQAWHDTWNRSSHPQ